MNLPAILTLSFSVLFLYRNWKVFRELKNYKFHFSDIFQFALLPVLGLTIFWISVVGAGSWILDHLSLSGLSIALKIVLSFAFGTSCFGIYLAILMASGLFQTLWISLFVGPSFILGWSALREFLSRIILPGSFTPIQMVCLAFIAWGLVISFLQTLLPPIDTDSLAYHLAIPKFWLKNRKMYYIPWLWHICFPFHAGMFNALSIHLGLETLSQEIHWLFGAMTALLLLSWNVPPIGLTPRLFAAACYVCLPVINHSMVTPRNDVTWAFYSFLSCMFLISPVPVSTSQIICAAVFSGIASSSRYHALYFSGITALIALICHHLNVTGFFLYASIMIAIAAPWYIRNWIWTRNPIWPLLYPLLGGSNWSIDLHNRYKKAFYRNPLDVRNWFNDAIRHIWKPTYVNDAAHYFIIPLFILMALEWRFWTRSDFFFLGLVALPYLSIILTLGEFWWRFSTPLIPSACLLLGWLLAQGMDRLGDIHFIYWIAWIAFIPSLWERLRRLPVTLVGLRDQEGKRNSREEYLYRNINIYPAIDWLNKNLPVQAKVILIREVRGFHLERDYMWGDPMMQGIILYENITNSSGLYQKWMECGITHVLINEHDPVHEFKEGFFYIDPRVLNMVGELLRDRGKLLNTLNDVSVYEIKRNDLSR